VLECEIRVSAWCRREHIVDISISRSIYIGSLGSNDIDRIMLTPKRSVVLGVTKIGRYLDISGYWPGKWVDSS
jgi:hypothetical protein